MSKIKLLNENNQMSKSKQLITNNKTTVENHNNKKQHSQIGTLYMALGSLSSAVGLGISKLVKADPERPGEEQPAQTFLDRNPASRELLNLPGQNIQRSGLPERAEGDLAQFRVTGDQIANQAVSVVKVAAASPEIEEPTLFDNSPAGAAVTKALNVSVTAYDLSTKRRKRIM